MLSVVTSPHFLSGTRVLRTQAKLKSSTPHVQAIARRELTSVSLYAVGSLLSKFLYKVDGRRKFKRNSMFRQRICGELLCTTFLRSSYCCQFSSILICTRGGWAPQIQAQLIASVTHQRRISLQNLPWISLYAVSSLLS